MKPMEIDDVLKCNTEFRDVIPCTPGELLDYVACYCGHVMPDYAPGETPCPGHDSPSAYLVGSFFSNTNGWSRNEKRRYSPHSDCIVWANRSGGKTMMGAISARLKAHFMSPCGIRILGGSSDQAKKMYDHVSRVDLDSFSDTVVGNATQEKTRYRGGSNIEILMASMKSVRGPHVPVLVLDEVDEISKQIHTAAVSIAQSSGKTLATIEQFSTAHNPNGLMQEIIGDAEKTGKRLYKWCIFEVLRKCPYPCTPKNPNKKCKELVKYDQLNQPHVFSDVCGCKAKRSRGYYRIEDLWQKFEQPTMSWESFAAEYLCEMPKVEDSAFPMLAGIHLVADWPCIPAPDGWLGSQYRLVLGADAGPVNTWVVWALVGRLDPVHDDFVVNDNYTFPSTTITLPH
jgi:hypothetical protein